MEKMRLKTSKNHKKYLYFSIFSLNIGLIILQKISIILVYVY